LHEILPTLPIADGTVDEVQEPLIVAAYQVAERARVPIEGCLYDLRIVEIPQLLPMLARFARARPRQFDDLFLACPRHVATSVSYASAQMAGKHPFSLSCCTVCAKTEKGHRPTDD
jgi:hypothetical protein